ncbi:hypothetical protein LTR85_007267 [Meristemomyces frigidus]|nr:hypothetical protein LTR85_007267 [Meristemomyces frigidus]
MAVDGFRRQATLAGMPMKYVSLITLVFQNSLLILIMHYSRVMPLVNGQRYYTSTAVFLNEVIKLAISLTMALYEIATDPKIPETSTAAGLFGELGRAVFTGDSWKMAIPAMLYTLQNTLQYVGLSNLDASTFQVTYQLKILTTAVFSVMLLGRTLGLRKWLSLLLLTVGVAIVQIPTEPREAPVLSIKDLKDGMAFHSPRNIWDLKALGNAAAGQLSKRSATYEGIDEDFAAANPQLNATIGLIAVAVACVLSGMAGVYFEKILKDSKGDAHLVSVWIRNVQLSFYSLWPALFIGVLFKDGEHIAKTGFFTGYNWVVWLAIVVQATGGVIVALVVNYTDNIAKNFATSISIIVSFLASVFFFDFHITSLYLLGTAIVLGATYMYNATAADRRARPPPISVSDYEKSGEPSYFDLESVTVAAKSPLRGEALSTSRPGTPTFERRPRPKSPGPSLTISKRESAFGGVGMDQRIFDQLDVLERGARNERRPIRDEYHNSSTEYSAYDGHHAEYGQPARIPREYERAYDDAGNEPMVLDSFDEQILRHPDYDSRHEQAAFGRARMPLMDDMGPLDPGQRAPALNLSRFAFDSGQAGPSSSSPYHQPLHSSPAFNASQRRPSAHEVGRGEHRPIPRPSAMDLGQPSVYQPLSLEQLQQEEQHMQGAQLEAPNTFRPAYMDQPLAKSKHDKTAAPIVRGINLISTHDLPDRFRSIFSFPLFNAVQSKSFSTIYKSNDNFVLSAPTGSGKTAVLELAICRLITGFASGSYKIVYQAPTKSLCSERHRDWQAKFGPLDLQCAELTGDTDNAQLRNVQSASIIITTPEKWDSITRKWKDHQKLMNLVKLFLIDEVHLLKEDRGATLEAVVSRMKSVGSDVRFVALSATVPNCEDISAWLGKDPMNPHLPAPREKFGEDFRPVRLQKHVCGYQSNLNDFAFEKLLNSKLPEVIAKWSQRKPIMVFCFTRAACLETAKLLATWWATKSPKERYWSPPRKRITVGDKDLRDTISSGVAFHHAGLQMQDRAAVEKGYLEGDVNVICCTSTLAVGVNLPCHMAIIKNTVSYQNNAMGGCKEYSDLEIMQMLGRAGRPQFDDSAVAVIMTRLQRVQYYEKMMTGQEVLESCLHRNLIDHLNAEIGLGTITSASSAKKWLSGTFLYVRLKENPEHYKLDGDAPGRNLDERLENICAKGIALLEETDLVTSAPKLHCTEFGDAMARYYLQFDTMRTILALPPKAKVSEILSAISQAAEFKDVRFRAGEKPAYKDLNKNSSIKFPIPVNLDAPAHKVSLIIQSTLGAVELPGEEGKHRIEYMSAKTTIFQTVRRLVRCIVDCQLYLDDAVTTRNALMLARSLGAQVWDDSPLHMKQLEGVGLVSVRKLAVAGIKSIEDIENAEAHRLEQLMSRQPPFGRQLQERARAFPKLRISLKAMGEPVIKKGEHVTIKVKADIGFLNERVPEFFNKRPVYVCLLAETSDGHKVHFARISAKKLNNGQDVLFSANLTNASQTVRAYVMCDEIAGTARHAMLKPEIPAIAFPPLKTAEQMNQQRTSHAPNSSKRRASAGKAIADADNASDDFGGAELDDADFTMIKAGGFVNIDDLDDAGSAPGKPKTKKQKTTHATVQAAEDWEPRQLANGKWACNHACKDKTACKHLCCREGLDKKPKPPKLKEGKKQETESKPDPKQTQLSMGLAKRATLPTPATSSVAKAAQTRKVDESREARDLLRLHNSVKTHTPRVPIIGNGDAAYSKDGSSRLSFLGATRSVEDHERSDDYGIDIWDDVDIPSGNDLTGKQLDTHMSLARSFDDMDEFDDGTLDADLAALASHHSQALGDGHGDGHIDLSSFTNEHAMGYDEDWKIEAAEDDDIGLHMAATPQKTKSGDDFVSFGNGKSIFMSEHGDPMQGGSTAVPNHGRKRSYEDRDANNDAGSSKFFAPSKKQKGPSRTPSAQLRQDLERAMQPVIEETFSDDHKDGRMNQDASNSQDELEAWFKAEFGTEHFNYVR